MMKPISTFGQTSIRSANLRKLEAELNTANNELATGMKSDVAKDLGSGLINLQTLRNQFSENEAYLRTIDLYKQRYEMMDRSFGEAIDAVESLVEVASINGADALDSATSVPLVAEGAIDRFIAAFNTSIGGRYLFSGANVDTAPMQGLDRPNAGGVTPRQAIDETLTATPPAPLPGGDSGTDWRANPPLTPADSLEILARFEAVFQGANAGTDYSFEDTFFNGELGGMLAEVRLPNNQYQTQDNVQFTDAMRSVLQGAWILASTDLTAIDDPATYQTLMTGQDGPPPVRGALELVVDGLDSLRRARADLGIQWKLVDAAEQATESQNALFNNEIVALEGVDRAEVTTRLLDIENQLEASYTATGRVMQLNFWNYVR